MENEKQGSFSRFNLKVYYCDCGNTNYSTDEKPADIKCMFCGGSVNNDKPGNVKRKD